MAKSAGTQDNLVDLLNELIALDLDAVAAYRVAIEKLSNVADRDQLGEFLGDHARHVVDLRGVVEDMGGDPADTSDFKAGLTRGRVFLGSIFGDRAILMAMRSNETDTNEAYERACSQSWLPMGVRAVLLRNWGDEQRHRAYIEQRLSGHEPAPMHH